MKVLQGIIQIDIIMKEIIFQQLFALPLLIYLLLLDQYSTLLGSPIPTKIENYSATHVTLRPAHMNAFWHWQSHVAADSSVLLAALVEMFGPWQQLRGVLEKVMYEPMA